MKHTPQIDTALDIPSLKEMNEQIKSLRLLKILIPSDKKDELKKLIDNFNSFVNTINKFYSTLGEKNWIFHEMLNFDDIRDILSDKENNYEAKFISIYTNEKNLSFFINQLNGLDQFEIRKELILKAKDDYLSGRYYSAVYILLATIDGFVNDFENQHRGFHARNSDDFGSLDSVVAHHKGISRIHKLYTKSFSLTVTEPVYELYRNGIMHGIILNFDNLIIATKAWNLLFSIKDWASAKLKEKQPQKSEKTWSEVFAQIKTNNIVKRDLNNWKPYKIGVNEANFLSETAFISCDKYMKLWKQKNYGKMSELMMASIRKYEGSLSPKYTRDVYSSLILEDYSILKIDHCAPAICEISIEVKLENLPSQLKIFRWIFEDKNGQFLTFNGSIPGAWQLVIGYH